MIEPKEVSDVFAVFPANVIGVYLPEMKDIPDEFQDIWRNDGGPCAVAHALCTGTFITGKAEGTASVDISNDGTFHLLPKEGIDAEKAWRHICACRDSYEPRHEHKIAGMGYLLSLWFHGALLDNKILWVADGVEVEGAVPLSKADESVEMDFD